jgi:hypothetical protein
MAIASIASVIASVITVHVSVARASARAASVDVTCATIACISVAAAHATAVVVASGPAIVLAAVVVAIPVTISVSFVSGAASAGIPVTGSFLSRHTVVRVTIGRTSAVSATTFSVARTAAVIAVGPCVRCHTAAAVAPVIFVVAPSVIAASAFRLVSGKAVYVAGAWVAVLVEVGIMVFALVMVTIKVSVHSFLL